MPDPVLLIGDIGGTNARFALADPASPGFDQVAKLACADFPTAEAAIAHYLSQVAARDPDVICLAAAGPVVDGHVVFTNNDWRLSATGLAERFGARSVSLLNDFEAVACSLPFLGEDDLHVIGAAGSPAQPGRDFNFGVLGPGTGLGVAGLLGRAGAIYPVVGEGGHRGFAPETPRQVQVLETLRARFGRVSDERVLSGPGLENLHEALRELEGCAGDRVEAAEVFALARSGDDPVAVEAVDLFFEALGQVAGNLALELGAYDGIFVAGGIVKRYPALLRDSAFRTGFERKGRHRALMEGIPTRLITHPDPGLLGAAWQALHARSA